VFPFTYLFFLAASKMVSASFFFSLSVSAFTGVIHSGNYIPWLGLALEAIAFLRARRREFRNEIIIIIIIIIVFYVIQLHW
jgi:hypothetical protein